MSDLTKAACCTDQVQGGMKPASGNLFETIGFCWTDHLKKEDNLSFLITHFNMENTTHQKVARVVSAFCLQPLVLLGNPNRKSVA